MALTAPLFTAPGPGKALLDRCALANDGRFFQGMPSRNGLVDAVTRIRTALDQLGFRTGDTPGVYGPSTAEAVRKYKGSPRNILGPGQRVPDNIVGIQTIARLDQEIQFRPAPPLTVGSTLWRFHFFGNKGFSARGIYTLFIASQQMQDSREFTVFERSSSGTLLAGFKGESAGTFTTPRKSTSASFSRATTTLKMFKTFGQDMLDGDLQIVTLGVANVMSLRLVMAMRDETMGTAVTSGTVEIRGDLN